MRALLVLLSCVVLAAGTGRAQSFLNNPGAESGTGSGIGSTAAGWIVGGAATGASTNPGRDDGLFDNIPVHAGAYDFYGGNGAGNTGAVNTLYQDVNLLSVGLSAATIDLGNTSAGYEFFEQSYDQGVNSDTGGVRLFFLDAAGTALGTLSSGELANVGSWLNASNSALIPAGTRSIRYEMFFTLRAGSDIDAFIDDNRLILTGVPEPATWALVGVGAAGCWLLRRRRAQA